MLWYPNYLLRDRNIPPHYSKLCSNIYCFRKSVRRIPIDRKFTVNITKSDGVGTKYDLDLQRAPMTDSNTIPGQKNPLRNRMNDASTWTARLAALDLTLPPVATPAGSYLPAVQTGSYVYTSGQLPLVDGTTTCIGKLGEGVSVEDAAPGGAVVHSQRTRGR